MDRRGGEKYKARLMAEGRRVVVTGAIGRPKVFLHASMRRPSATIGFRGCIDEVMDRDEPRRGRLVGEGQCALKGAGTRRRGAGRRDLAEIILRWRAAPRLRPRLPVRYPTLDAAPRDLPKA